MSKVASDEIMAGKILAARRALRRTDWDGSDLDNFVQVLCRLDADHGWDDAMASRLNELLDRVEP